MACSLMGTYRHAKYLPRFTLRLAVYDLLFLNPQAKEVRGTSNSLMLLSGITGNGDVV